MNETKRLIFKVDRLKKNYGSLEAVNVKKLEIHPGTIYALVGPPGSGKTTLLDILSGSQKQSSGELYFENSKYKTNWFGKVLKHDEIFYNYGFDDYGTGSSVGKIINKMYGKKSNTIMKRHFNSPRFKHLWNRSVSSLTKGELHWVGMVLSLESDPRVLLIDEYGVHITNNMEQEFRTQLRRMNRTLGTTIILSTPNEDLVKNFASVLIFMDNGHISKIRSKSNRIGGPRRPGRRGHFNHKKKNTKARGSSNKPPVNKQGGKSDQNSGNSSRGSSNKPPVNKQGGKSDQNSENSSRGSVSRHSSSKQNPESNNSPENKSIDTHNRNLETPSNPNPVSSNPNSGNESISLDIQTSVGKNSVSISKPPAPLETPKPSNSETIKPKNKSNNANAKTSANEEVVAKRSKSQIKEQTEKS